MARTEENIEHEGIVTDVREGALAVTITSASACSACEAHGSCVVGNVQDKDLDIETPDAAQFSKGDTVRVILRKSLGHWALFWGYVFPFIMVLGTLLTASPFMTELAAGLLALAVLVPYYGVVYILRDRFKQTFRFGVKKIHK
ncbi:MAG: SoxR reducing system RseC family protein [Candidatus Omnitrophota bacterium]